MSLNSDEALQLRRTTRDIIAISSLPSIWAHYSVKQVADSLVEVLYRSLSLDFAYVRIHDHDEKFQTAYTRAGSLNSSDLDLLTAQLAPLLQKDLLGASSRTINSPIGEGQMRVNLTPLGHGFKNGILITGTLRPQFPAESDRLILNIASNQTNVIVEAKWLQTEARNLLAVAEEREARLREATKLAEIAKAEAENANELKSSFLANMSHEIRTPLGAILGFTDVLKNSNLSSSERSEYLEIITRSGQSLTKIIDDILDLSKIEAGKLEIEALPLSLASICKEVIAMFSDRTIGKGINLLFDDSGIPKFNISSDQVRIRQVLVNLIGNAVKFTSQGSITISGSYIENADGLIQTSVDVADTGVGMSKAVSSHLFQPFSQGDNTSTRKFGGTGLGLALSKKLGNALGGDVLLSRCEENKGCTFTFQFLAPKSEIYDLSSSEKIRNLSKDKELLKGYKVLVADDSPDNRLLMNLILTKYGAVVHFAQDGEDAVQKSLENDFDVVLMDIQMPVLDGFGALAKLRKADFKKPVFALTAHAMKEDRNRAIASGFTTHVAKPVNPKELVESILTHAPKN